MLWWVVVLIRDCLLGCVVCYFTGNCGLLCYLMVLCVLMLFGASGLYKALGFVCFVVCVLLVSCGYSVGLGLDCCAWICYVDLAFVVIARWIRCACCDLFYLLLCLLMVCVVLRLLLDCLGLIWLISC